MANKLEVNEILVTLKTDNKKLVPQLRFSARNKIKNLLISLKKKGVMERLGCSLDRRAHV